MLLSIISAAGRKPSKQSVPLVATWTASVKGNCLPIYRRPPKGGPCSAGFELAQDFLYVITCCPNTIQRTASDGLSLCLFDWPVNEFVLRLVLKALGAVRSSLNAVLTPLELYDETPSRQVARRCAGA